MEFRTARETQKQEVKTLIVYIGKDSYRLSESVDGRLNINKITHGEEPEHSDYIRVHPRTGNEIEIS
jgi:hypothetical protein